MIFWGFPPDPRQRGHPFGIPYRVALLSSESSTPRLHRRAIKDGNLGLFFRPTTLIVIFWEGALRTPAKGDTPLESPIG